MSDRGTGRMSRRAIAVWVAAVLVVTVALLALPRRSGQDTLAFRRFLAHAGMRLLGGPPVDGLGAPEPDWAERLREELEAGHLPRSVGRRVVVADAGVAHCRKHVQDGVAREVGVGIGACVEQLRGIAGPRQIRLKAETAACPFVLWRATA